MESYEQFCPVARASQIVTRRWTLLVLRELMAGSHRFNDLHRGVPKMSRSLLSRRLGELERAKVVERRLTGEDGHPEYHLTRAGEELKPIIGQLGLWGLRWLEGEVSREDLDAGLLMWDVRRRVAPDVLPGRRVVVHFHFTDSEEGYEHFWLVLEPDAVDLCLNDPGYKSDLEVATDVRTLTNLWLGHLRLATALRDGDMRLRGPRELRRRFPDWLGLSAFVELARAR